MKEVDILFFDFCLLGDSALDDRGIKHIEGEALFHRNDTILIAVIFKQVGYLVQMITWIDPLLYFYIFNKFGDVGIGAKSCCQS